MENKKYILPKTGEEVALERWAWAVVYKDNSILLQFDDDGTFHQVGEIDQENIKYFVMYKPEDITKRIEIIFPEGARLIHKYRNIRPHYKDHFVKVYLFGYKLENNFCYHFILPNDRVLISNTDVINLETFNL